MKLVSSEEREDVDKVEEQDNKTGIGDCQERCGKTELIKISQADLNTESTEEKRSAEEKNTVVTTSCTRSSKMGVESFDTAVTTNSSRSFKAVVEGSDTAVTTSCSRSCKMGVESSDTSDLSHLLNCLELKDGEDEKACETEGQTSQPTEVDAEDDLKEAETKLNELKITDSTEGADNLVKLEAPTFSETEEDGQKVESAGGELHQILAERGPMYGIPSNFTPEVVHCTGGSTTFPEYVGNSYSAAMPAGFPNYSLQNSSCFSDKGLKRGVEDYVYQEPPKYTRPQFSYVEGPNNGVGNMLNAAASASTAGKTISCVYKSQLSGGTCSENIAPATPDHILSGNLDSFGPLSIPDLLDLVSADDTLIGSLAGHLPPGLSQVSNHGQISNAQMFVSPNQKSEYGLQGSLAPISREALFSQCKEFESYHNEKRSSHSNTSDDNISDGYVSDFSPLHEPQTSPMPSPLSAVLHGSPPRSPPLSNLSHYSVDSGMGSPLSEDLNYYTVQNNRRRHGSIKSQQPSVAGTTQMTKVVASPEPPPPQHHMVQLPTQHIFMQPPHHVMIPPHQHPAPPQQIVPGSMPPGVMFLRPAPHNVPAEQQAGPRDSFVEEDYVDPFINGHLDLLSDALIVASEDLMAEKARKGLALAALLEDKNPLRNSEGSCVSTIAQQENKVASRNTGNVGTFTATSQEKLVSAPRHNGSIYMSTASSHENMVTLKSPEIRPANGICPTFQFGNGGMTANNVNKAAGIKTSSVNSCADRNIIRHTVVSKPTYLPGGPAVFTTASLSPSHINFNPSYISLSQASISPSQINISPSHANKSPSHANISPSPVNTSPSQGNTSPSRANISPSHANISPSPINTNPSQVNIKGQVKIAIPPMSQKARPPVTVKTCQVWIMPQNVLPKPSTGTRLRPIAPKGPAKTMETAEAGSGKPDNGCAQKVNDQEHLQPNNSAVNKRNAFYEKRLNLARRMVAERSTEEFMERDEDGDTILHLAVCQADSFMLQALLERLGREKLIDMINGQNKQGQTPLYLAVSIKDAEMVRLLVEYGANVSLLAESTTSSGVPEKVAAIHCASSRGEKYLDTLRALLKAPGIDLHQMNSDGHTALHCAIHSHGREVMNEGTINSIPIIEALIKAGADPNFKVQQSGKTSLMFALESRNLDLIENIFSLVEPAKLGTFLKTQAHDSSSCQKIAESLKATLDQAGQHRLNSCLRLANSRGLSSHHLSCVS